MNLYTDISPWIDEQQHIFSVVVEIPTGTSNKIEYHSQGGYFFLSRALYQPIYYPFDYGFIPQTMSGDGDPLDVMLLVTHPTFTGCVVHARTIGGIMVTDQAGQDEKILAVPVHSVDPRWDDVASYTDLPTHLQKELLVYFKEYRKLEVEKYDHIRVDGFFDVDTAISYIQKAHATYGSGKE